MISVSHNKSTLLNLISVRPGNGARLGVCRIEFPASPIKPFAFIQQPQFTMPPKKYASHSVLKIKDWIYHRTGVLSSDHIYHGKGVASSK